MQAVINAVNIVLSIFIIIGMGIYLTWRNRLTDENAALISHLVVKVALPCSIINNLFTSFDSASMLECIRGLIAPVLSIFIMLLLGMALARLLKLPQKRRVSYVMLEEDLTVGQRVESFFICSAGGRPLFRGTTIGHKRICPVNAETDTITVTVTSARAKPTFRAVRLF